MEALMRDDQLPSPGLVTNGNHLRRVVANVLSYIEVNKRPDGTHPEADNLKTFFDAASTEAAKYDEVTPTNSVVPTITGTAQVGQTLTRTLGTFAGGGLTRTTQWRRGSTDIAGATGATYNPSVADIGQAITVRVTARNTVGSVSATSTATANVIAA
jgi:hypothetical protein